MICPHCSASNAAHQTHCIQCNSRLSTTASGYDAADRIGTVLGGRYRLRTLIGIGSAGAVYKAEILGVGTPVAIKVLHPHVAEDQQAKARLENEARLASKIDHPNIVSILDMESGADLTYLVMEYLSGVSLDEVLAEVGFLGLRRSIHIVRQLLAALEASHRFEVLHRDLKPDNIYLTAREDRLDFVKVVDFGLATLRHREQESRITVEGHVCGTPGYMAPEQARNHELTERTDLYAVGVILYECLTGINPFLGGSTVDTMVNQITLTPQVPSKANASAGIPLYLDALVMRALSKSPDQRFSSAREFRQVLEGLVLAQKHKANAAEQPMRTCDECGNMVAQAQTHCSACGTPVPTVKPVPGAMQKVMTPELINAAESSGVPAAELELSSTTTIRAYRSVGWDPPLVGRRDELRQINEMLAQAEPRQAPRFLRILGGAGLGKGRLAREAIQRAEKAGWTVVWIEPLFHPAFASLYPIQAAAGRLLGAPTSPDKETLLEAATRAGFNPKHRTGLLELFGLAPPSQDPADDRRKRRALALREAMRCAANQSPLLVVFQDLHHYDTPSQELVAALVSKEPMPNPVGVIVTHDPQLLLLWPETKTMTVQALSTDEAKMLAVSLLNHVQIKLEDIGSIISASKGSPLMLIELVRLAAIDSSFRPPRSLPEVINQRISLLPPKTRTLLHTMSVLGRPTHADTLVAVLDEKPEAEHRAIRFLAEQGFLVDTTPGWRPSHRMHQQVAYASIPAALRLQLHAKAADLAIDEGEPSALVAYHLTEAGDHEQAVPFLLRAGNRALYFVDDQLASKLFSSVLRLVPQPPEPFHRERGPWTDATLGLAIALQDGGEQEHAIRLLKHAVARTAQAGWKREEDRLAQALRALRQLGQHGHGGR